MFDMPIKNRKQGLDELKAQKAQDYKMLALRSRVAMLEEKLVENPEWGDVLRNKINFYNKKLQEINEKSLQRPKVGLDEMKKTTDEQGQIQSRNDFESQIILENARMRMVQENERLQKTSKKHQFYQNKEEEDQRIVKAGTDPIHNEKDDLENKLEKAKKRYNQKARSIINAFRKGDINKEKAGKLLLALNNIENGRGILGKGKKLSGSSQRMWKDHLRKEVKKGLPTDERRLFDALVRNRQGHAA